MRNAVVNLVSRYTIAWVYTLTSSGLANLPRTLGLTKITPKLIYERLRRLVMFTAD